MAERPQTKHAWRLTVLALLLGLLALLLPLLTLRVGPKWDALDQFLPAFTYLADAFRQGRLPLWDPYTNCGYPFHAEPQFTPFNPLALVLALVIERPAVGFVWFWALNWLWGGLGMLRLARYCGATPLGAVTAAAGYALGGFFIGHASHTSYILVAAWLPWLFAFADRAVANRKPAYALLAGAALGLSAFGGYPGLVLFTCLALALWLCLRHLFAISEEPGPGWRVRAGWIAATLAVAAVVLLLVWSPKLNAFFLEGAGYTDRVGQLDSETANLGHPFSPAAAISVLFPFATIVGRQWMGADITMTNAYMGILTLPLAVFWFWKSRGRLRPWWLPAFAGFMLLVSLGGEYGLRSLLYELYPPMRYMRFSAPFRLFWMLPLTLTAGLAVSQLARHPEDRSALLKVLLGWAATAVAATAAFVLLAPMPTSDLIALAPRLFLPGLAVLAAAIAVTFWLGRERGPRWMNFLPVVLMLLVCGDMAGHLYNNAMTVWGPRTVVEQLETHHRRETVVNGTPQPRHPGRPFGYLNAQQVVKTPLVQGYVTLQTEGFNQTLLSSRFVELLSAPFRFWLTPGVEQPSSAGQALAVLAQSGARKPVAVFVEDPPAAFPVQQVVPGSFGLVQVLSYAPERVELSVQVPGSKPAFLASTERHAAGWKVTIDGVAQRVWKTNLYFRGTVVPPGPHRVVWTYEPARLVPLLGVSYLTLAAILTAAAILLWRERRDPGRLS